MARTQTVSATGTAPSYSAWMPVDYGQNAFGIGFTCNITSGAVLTYSVQYTEDNLSARQSITSITRSGTSVTITVPSHNLTAGDSIVVEGANIRTYNDNTGISTTADVFDGTFQVASVTPTTIVYTVANAGNTVGDATGHYIGLRVSNHATVVAQTTTQSGNFAFPCTACRIVNTAWTSGTSSLTANQGRK